MKSSKTTKLKKMKNKTHKLQSFQLESAANSSLSSLKYQLQKSLICQQQFNESVTESQNKNDLLFN